MEAKHYRDQLTHSILRYITNDQLQNFLETLEDQLREVKSEILARKRRKIQ